MEIICHFLTSIAPDPLRMSGIVLYTSSSTGLGWRSEVKSTECGFVLTPNVYDLLIGCGEERYGLTDLPHFCATVMAAMQDGHTEI